LPGLRRFHGTVRGQAIRCGREGLLGRDETIALVLEQLGFEVERETVDEAEAEVLAAARGLTSAEALGLLWVLSRFRQGELAELDEDRLAGLLSEYKVAGSAETR